MGHRHLCVLLLTVLAHGACGEVKKYADAGSGDDVTIDASTADGPACADQTCGGATTDGCCPAACNAASDGDCAATCDNQVIEPGESCDPLTSCPTACPQIGCQLRALTGGGTCAAACSNDGMQTACSQSSDGCCPDVCNATSDIDCAATCDNGVVEVGEQCDPLATCPTSCPAVECTTYQLFDGGTCRAQCVESGTISACNDGDGCCPGNGLGACNANNDSDCTPVCGNGTIESGENCEGGGCACAGEQFTCFTSVGGPESCNIECHLPIQECGPEDGCCPYLAGSGGERCTRNDDPECAGDLWQVRDWARADYREGCTTISVYGIDAGTSYLFTTCANGNEQPGQGDSVIDSVVDNRGISYDVANDNCTEPSAIPHLHGWDCRSETLGGVRMSCASPNDGGFIVTDPQVNRLDITICPRGSSGRGHSPFHIWWNGPGYPNEG